MGNMGNRARDAETFPGVVISRLFFKGVLALDHFVVTKSLRAVVVFSVHRILGFPSFEDETNFKGVLL